MRIMHTHNITPTSSSLSRSVNWRPLACVPQAQWSSSLLRDWIKDCSSLTARLKACCDHFQLQVKCQQFAYPDCTEQRILRLQPRRYALLREVYLFCDGEPWIFGHTFFPLTTLVGEQRRLSAIGTRPLGERLFQEPTLQREDFEVARLTPAHTLFHRTMQDVDEAASDLWARRSVFHVQYKSLLVTEIFLPAMRRFIRKC